MSGKIFLRKGIAGKNISRGYCTELTPEPKETLMKYMIVLNVVRTTGY